MLEPCWDVIIVGAGPSGAAAAILCAEAGLKTLVLERSALPRAHPGETLHPGAQSVLRGLGVLEAVERAGFPRPTGMRVTWGKAAPAWQPYGSPEGVPLRGYQVDRAIFDALLVERARAAGAVFRQQCKAERPIVAGGRVIGVHCASGPEYATFVLDAAGPRRWLARALGLPVDMASRPFVARYGYLEGLVGESPPSLTGTANGWLWVAPVSPTRLAWVRLGFDRLASAAPPAHPPGLSALEPPRAEEVSWYCVRPTAGPGYFILGDAASRADPVLSYGLLKALLSGERAARWILGVMAGEVSESTATREYAGWVSALFAHDCAHLCSLHEQLGATAAGVYEAPATHRPLWPPAGALSREMETHWPLPAPARSALARSAATGGPHH